jgi:hypothetical protein
MVAWVRDDFECFRRRISGLEHSDPETLGEVCNALEGKGLTSPLLREVMDCVAMVSLGEVLTTTMHWAGLQRGEIVVLFFPSPDRGCKRSGESALRRRGDPGSADLGRLVKDFLAEPGVRLAPGE